jgi:hypothetical protein
MPGRHSSLVVRILLVPLVVLAPLGVLAAFALLFPSAPDGLGPVLMMLYFFYAIAAIILVPAALFWAPDSSPGPSGDGADGGDMDPPPPTAPPSAPPGGVPLPDAEQTRGRVRDHDRPDRRLGPTRRAPQEPERAPVPKTPADQLRHQSVVVLR